MCGTCQTAGSQQMATGENAGILIICYCCCLLLLLVWPAAYLLPITAATVATGNLNCNFRRFVVGLETRVATQAVLTVCHLLFFARLL